VFPICVLCLCVYVCFVCMQTRALCDGQALGHPHRGWGICHPQLATTIPQPAPKQQFQYHQKACMHTRQVRSALFMCTEHSNRAPHPHQTCVAHKKREQPRGHALHQRAHARGHVRGRQRHKLGQELRPARKPMGNGCLGAGCFC